MHKRATIKDVALQAGVSIGSVHCALTGKPGVSDETRARIEETARRCNYKPNTIASSLKRKTLKIAAAIPALVGENRYFFSDIWQGVNDYLAEMADYNIDLIQVPFYGDQINNQDMELHALLERTHIDGLISVGYTPVWGLVSLQEYKKRSIPFVIAGSDIPDSGRLCCVRPNYLVVGKTMAELVLRQIGKEKAVLMCAGRPQILPHYQVVEGFENYIKECGAVNPVYKIHAMEDSDIDCSYLVRLLKDQNFAAACSVTARDSVRLSEALRIAGKEKDIFCIGMDVFNENKQALRDGVFDNLVQNNPYKCAFLATKILVNYLLDADKKPLKDVIEVNSEIVFRSNVCMFDSVNYRLQM